MKYSFSIFTIVFLLGIGFTVAHIVPVFAQSADELRERITETNKEIVALEEEIAQYENELEDIQGEKNTLAREIQRIDVTRRKLAADIALTGKKISVQEDEIIRLTNSIEDKDDAISVEKTSMASSLRELQEVDDRSTIELLLSERSLSDFWSEVSELQAFYRQLAVHTQELKTLREDLSTTREEVEAEKRELEALRQQLAGQKRVADSTRAEKNQLLAATENKESEYQALLEEKRKQREELEEAIFDYESQLEFILDPDKFPAAQHGVFSWPLDHIYITQLFGKTGAAKRLYADGSHSGVDFRASVGTPVKAPADGVIMGTGDTGAFPGCISHGKWVVIDHKNGLATRYSHLSDIAVAKGKQMKRGEIFAYSGNTGYSTGPHLHISVNIADAIQIVRLGDIVNYKSKCADAHIPVSPKNAYLDPLEYLPVYQH